MSNRKVIRRSAGCISTAWPDILSLGVIGIFPFWNRLRSIEAFQAALRGINAAGVGILLAALYQPIWVSAIHAPIDFALSLLAFGLLVIWKVPPWVVVILAALIESGLSML